MFRTLFILTMALFGQLAFAQYDVTAPQLISVTAAGKYLIGKEAKIIVDASDNSSGIVADLESYDKRGFNSFIYNSKDMLETDIRLIRVEKVSESQFALIYSIGSNVQPGEYSLATLTMADKANNVASYRKPYAYDSKKNYLSETQESNVPVFKFMVLNPLNENDVEAPVVQSLNVTGNLLVGGEFSIIVQAQDALAGISPIAESYDKRGFNTFIYNSKDMLETDIRLVRVNQLSNTLFQLTFQVGTNVQPGEYSLASLTIADKANNVTTYRKPYAYDSKKNYVSENQETSLPVLKFFIVHP